MAALTASTALPERADGNALVRLPGVIALSGMGRATIYDFMQRGLFPAPIKIGPKLAAWPRSEIDRINGARIAGKSSDEIKAIVAELMGARKDRI
jgi:prophage regulatory protein